MYNYNYRYAHIIKTILNSPFDTFGHNVRPKYEDGTPAHTKFISFLPESFNIDGGEFPIHTLRPTAWKSAIQEYLWIFQDQTSDLAKLHDRGVTYWDSWDIGDGTIGQRYGATVKKYDLMNKIISGIKADPLGRRHIIDLFQYEDLAETSGLYPCQYNHTFMVRGEFLDLVTTIRSSDFLVASTINKIQAIALLLMVAKATGYKPGYFHHAQVNVHIYDRHFDNANILIDRYLTLEKTDGPKLIFNPLVNDFYSFGIDDFQIENYNPIKPQLRFELGV